MSGWDIAGAACLASVIVVPVTAIVVADVVLYVREYLARRRT